MTISLKSLRLLIVVGLAMLAQAAIASGRLTTIDYPGAKTTTAYGINTAGDVVGSYVDTSGIEHGFLFRTGTFTTFDYEGAVITQARGINSRGDITGQYVFKDGLYHGFLLKNGKFTDLEAPGQPNTMPEGINESGFIAGCIHGGPDLMHGFVMTPDGVFTAEPLVGAMHTGINTAGDVVGYTSETTGDRGYVISNSVRTWILVPGAALTRPFGINAEGDIVGVYQEASTKRFRGFLRHLGQIAPVDVALPGVTASRAFGVNALGDIVGQYIDASGTHGYLMRKTGWWWNPDKPGTGFMMERQGDKMLVTAFVYDYDGTPTWLTASGSVINGNFFAAAHAFANGQTLNGAYQPALDAGAQGTLQIQFTDAGTAQLSWVPNPFMFANMTLQRFGFTGGPETFGAIENGWWSNPAEPGRTFAIEVQDNNLFIIGSMFDDAGRPTWYLSFGVMSDPMQYSGNWTQYGMGPTMLGMGGSPMLINQNAGRLQLKFTDAQKGTVTLPDGRQIPIARLSF